MATKDELRANLEEYGNQPVNVEKGGLDYKVVPMRAGQARELKDEDGSDTHSDMIAITRCVVNPSSGDRVFAWPEDKQFLEEMSSGVYSKLVKAVNRVNGWTVEDSKGN